MFAEFDPEFYFLRLYDIDNAIEQFASDKKIDLIITIQKNILLCTSFSAQGI
jgi:hypothetical protein